MIRSLLTCSVFIMLGGCNLAKVSVNLTAPVLYTASNAFAFENDVTFAREAAPGQLKTADGFLVSSPANHSLLQLLARGYLEYPFGFLEDDLESMPDDNAHHDAREALVQRATNFYERALGYAVRDLVAYDKKMDGLMKKDNASFEAALNSLSKEAAPALLYGGMALASAVNLNRADITRVAELPKAVAMVTRSYALDKTIYNGAAAMTLGLINASQGKALGGNPDAAKKFFEDSIAQTQGKFLLARVMEARFYAVVTQDRALFEKILKEVIDTPADVMPSARLPNELAHRRAARYLKQADDLF